MVRDGAPLQRLLVPLILARIALQMIAKRFISHLRHGTKVPYIRGCPRAIVPTETGATNDPASTHPDYLGPLRDWCAHSGMGLNLPDRITAHEFREGLARLDMSLREFARYTGADERTVRRWAGGEQDIPPWVPVMLELMDRRTGE